MKSNSYRERAWDEFILIIVPRWRLELVKNCKFGNFGWTFWDYLSRHSVYFGNVLVGRGRIVLPLTSCLRFPEFFEYMINWLTFPSSSSMAVTYQDSFLQGTRFVLTSLTVSPKRTAQAVWKFITTTSGVLCVIDPGTAKTHSSSAMNWD